MCAQMANDEKEYIKNQRLKREDVDILKEWMNKQPHLPKISDLQIILFLHSCYYNIERTKMCIEKFYTIKGHIPELFAERNPLALHKYLLIGLVRALPHTGSDCILYMRIVEPAAQDIDFAIALKGMDMSNSLHQYECGTFKNHITILDATGLTLNHLMKVNLVIAKKAVVYLQEAAPIRLKHIHIINTSPIANRLYSMFKPLIKQELQNMIHFHNTLDTLFEYVPQKCLPTEYGGAAGTIRELHDKQLAHMLENWQFYDEEELLVCDESKRLSNSKYFPDKLFGIDGTFKKLAID